MNRLDSESPLSEEEVTDLLQTLEESKRAKARSVPRSSPMPPPRPQGKVAAYDFKRPERVGKDQMRVLQSMHEGFSRNFGAALSALVRSIAEVKLNGVDQFTYSEFVVGLPNPTCFNLLRADPLDGHLILDMSPAALFPIIDRLLGGGKEAGPPAKRALTEIELRLASRITKLCLHELERVWESITPLKLAVERVESNPNLIQVVPPNEVVIAISFEISLGEARGMFSLCIPFNAIERVSPRLQANSWFSYGKSETTPETIALLGQQIDRTAVELSVTLAKTKISTNDLLGLRVGDIIATEHDVQRPLEVCVGGVPKYTAYPGALKGNKAIRVEECLED